MVNVEQPSPVTGGPLLYKSVSWGSYEEKMCKATFPHGLCFSCWLQVPSFRPQIAVVHSVLSQQLTPDIRQYPNDYWFSVIPIKIPWTLSTQLGNKRLILKSLREHKRPLRHKAIWNKQNLAEGTTMPDSKTHSRNMVKWTDKQTNKRQYYIGIIQYHQRAIVMPGIKLHLKPAASQQMYQKYTLVKG